MNRLFVWSGGGFPGIDIHAGIWKALDEAGIQSTHNSGCSAGAIVAAVNSSDTWGSRTFAQFIASLDDSNLRETRFAWQLRLRWLDHIYSSERIVELLQSMLPPSWSDMRKPSWIWATRMTDAQKVDVANPTVSADPAHAVLASAAVPMIFPGVPLADGAEYWDGGLRFNLPIPKAWRAFDEVYLLIASSPLKDSHSGGGILTRAIRSLKILMHDQVQDVLDEVAGDPRVRVIWPQVDNADGFLRFNHALIDAAYKQTKLIIEKSNARKGV